MTLGPNGEILLPHEMLAALCIAPGDEVDFVLDEGGVRIEPVQGRSTVGGELAGFRLVETLEADHQAEIRPPGSAGRTA